MLLTYEELNAFLSERGAITLFGLCEEAYGDRARYCYRRITEHGALWKHEEQMRKTMEKYGFGLSQDTEKACISVEDLKTFLSERPTLKTTLVSLETGKGKSYIKSILEKDRISRDASQRLVKHLCKYGFVITQKNRDLYRKIFEMKQTNLEILSPYMTLAKKHGITSKSIAFASDLSEDTVLKQLRGINPLTDSNLKKITDYLCSGFAEFSDQAMIDHYGINAVRRAKKTKEAEREMYSNFSEIVKNEFLKLRDE
jgi:hypothetical protein